MPRSPGEVPPPSFPTQGARVAITPPRKKNHLSASVPCSPCASPRKQHGEEGGGGTDGDPEPFVFPGGGEGSSPTDRPARSRRLHYRARPLGGATALRAPCGASAPNLGTEHPPVPLLNGPLGGVLSPSFLPPELVSLLKESKEHALPN